MRSLNKATFAAILSVVAALIFLPAAFGEPVAEISLDRWAVRRLSNELLPIAIPLSGEESIKIIELVYFGPLADGEAAAIGIAVPANVDIARTVTLDNAPAAKNLRELGQEAKRQ